MSAVTVEDVANMALDLLVEAQIDTLDDDNKAARLLSRHFEVTRQAELIKHAWTFAIFRTELSSLAPADVPDGEVYDYAYEMPNDALRILPLTHDGEAYGVSIPWKLEGGLILSNQSGPRLVRYIGNLTDPADWNALFTEALAARLAAKIALPLTQKPQFYQVAKNAYDEAIADARRINAIERGSNRSRETWAEGRGDQYTAGWR